jgi:hypothetical protein
MSLTFCASFVMLWLTEYGEREGMKRYMSDFVPGVRGAPVPPTTTETPASPG